MNTVTLVIRNPREKIVKLFFLVRTDIFPIFEGFTLSKIIRVSRQLSLYLLFNDRRLLSAQRKAFNCAFIHAYLIRKNDDLFHISTNLDFLPYYQAQLQLAISVEIELS